MKRNPLLKLKCARYTAKISQVVMAHSINISIAAYINKENGKTEFTLAEIEAIMILLNSPFEDLFI